MQQLLRLRLFSEGMPVGSAARPRIMLIGRQKCRPPLSLMRSLARLYPRALADYN
jgi:hypothetical protein